MWVDQDNWVNDMAVDVLDEDAKEVGRSVGRWQSLDTALANAPLVIALQEKPIGTTHFSLLPYMKILPQVQCC